MAVIDPTTGAVVIRIVYDGAPFAGKTTSVRALGQGLGGTVRSPGEIGGRTLFFDWLDYTGGLFEGRQIRCQIVSVPGQAVLAPRRRRLLDSADVVVYVLDSTPEAFATERGYLEGLKATLARRAAPAVGVVVQANKRDVANATALTDLRAMIDAVGIRAAIVESAASEGSGVRETFVFAVRLALDRVRELLGTGQLLSQAPDVNDDRELLAELNRHDVALESIASQSELSHTRLSDIDRAPSSPLQSQSCVLDEVAVLNDAPTMAAEALNQVIAESGLPPTVAHESTVASPPLATAQNTRHPLLPDDRVASGFIWPVVVGRTILSELTGQICELQQTITGEWTGESLGRWRVQAHANSTYDDLERGRMDLVRWARMHVSCARLFSADRCIVLSRDHGGRGRMWQVLRVEATLRQDVESVLDGAIPSEQLATVLLVSLLAMGEIQSRCIAIGQRLPLSLASIAVGEVRATYVGCMPAPGEAHAPPVADAAAVIDAALDEEFEFAYDAIAARRGELFSLLEDTSALIGFALKSPLLGRASYGGYLQRASAADLDQAALRLTALLVRI